MNRGLVKVVQVHLVRGVNLLGRVIQMGGELQVLEGGVVLGRDCLKGKVGEVEEIGKSV